MEKREKQRITPLLEDNFHPRQGGLAWCSCFLLIHVQLPVAVGEFVFCYPSLMYIFSMHSSFLIHLKSEQGLPAKISSTHAWRDAWLITMVNIGSAAWHTLSNLID